MNRLFATLPIAAVLALSPVSIAQEAEPRPSIARYFNAALEYWKIWGTMDSELMNLVFDADDATITKKGSPAHNALIKLHPDIQSLIRASRMPICDWQIDDSKGLETQLPHLRRMRESAKLMSIDGRRLIGEGDVEGASVRVVAMLSIAAHFDEEHYLIGSLVDMAIVGLSCGLINDILDSGTSTQVDRDMMLTTLNQFSIIDPFDVLGTIAREQQIMIEWTEREFVGENSRDISEFVELFSFDDAPIEEHPFVKFTDEDVIEDLAKLSPAYDALVDAWHADDVWAAFDAINESVQAGDYGELAKLVLPTLHGVRRSSDLIDATMASTRERLAKTTDQVPDPTENPAPDSNG